MVNCLINMKIILKKLWHDLLWVLGYKAKWKK